MHIFEMCKKKKEIIYNKESLIIIKLPIDLSRYHIISRNK